MHTGRHYSLVEVGAWTRRETAIFLLIGALPTLGHQLLGWHWLTLPWLPIALIGTAVAFITGFKNNASYSRLWEARQIWGAIVNDSRSFAIQTLDFIGGPPEDKRRLIDRHLAWLTCLRYQLRESRPWENMDCRENVEYRRKYSVPEWAGTLDAELPAYLDAESIGAVLSAKNRAANVIAMQSKHLARLAADGHLSEYRHVEMSRTLVRLFDAQGRCERIKNFPYPRQFATLNLFFVWLFIALLPFGLIQEFKKVSNEFVWVTIPATMVVAWVFHTMDKIGEISENPFQGGPNDIPISALSRTIEIDLRGMFGDAKLPEPVKPVNDILM